MMPMDNAPFLLSVGIGILCLVGLHWAYRDARTDDTRDSLFALRDELFLYASDTGILDAPAHRQLRKTLNSLIRYTHKLTLSRLVALLVGKHFFKVQAPSGHSASWEKAVSLLPRAQAEHLNHIHRSAILIMAKHLISMSAFLLVGTLILRVVRFCGRSSNSATQKLTGRETIALLEDDALSDQPGGRKLSPA